jgi:hypothetical protein
MFIPDYRLAYYTGLDKKSCGKKQQVKALPKRMPRAGYLLYRPRFKPVKLTS